MEGGGGVNIALFLTDPLEYRTGVGIILGILRPDKCHGIQIDTVEHTTVFTDIEIIFRNTDAGFIAVPVFVLPTAGGVVPGHQGVAGTHGDRPGGGIKPGV